MSKPLPDSLIVAMDADQVPVVELWWSNLSSDQQRDVFDLLSHEANCGIVDEIEPNEGESKAESPDDWCEYVVNQDARFYFDCSNGVQSSHGYLVSGMISAVSAAADAEYVSHILTRKRG